MNSGRKCDEINDQQSRWDNVTLTKDSDGSYHTSFFHCFSLWIEWIERYIASVGRVSDGHLSSA